MPAPEPCEVAILGAGAAGVATAAQLARYGVHTVLLERGPRGRLPMARSLPGEAAELLHELGLESALEGALLPSERQLRWHAGAVETLPVRGARELLVAHDAFAAGLRRAVSRALPVHEGATARCTRDPAGSWRVQAGSRAWRPRLLIDARGGRSQSWMPSKAPPTAALLATYAPVPGVGTRVSLEALANAWIWSAPLPDGRLSLVACVDADRVQGLAAPAREALLRALLAPSTLLGALEERTPLDLSVCSVRTGVAREVAGADLLRVGDAALSLDPLSGQGILTALRGARLAATAARTMLRRPAHAAAATAFYTTRIARSHAAHQRATAAQYAAVTRYADQAFWRRRRGSAPPRAARPRPHPHPHPHQVAPWLRLAADARLEPTPQLHDGWVGLSPALHHPGLDHPIGSLHGVALEPLLRPLERPCETRVLLHRWARRAPLGQCRAILAFLLSAGVLTAAAVR